MQWAVTRGRTRKSQRAKHGGPTCLQIRALANESGAPTLAVKQAFYRLADEKRAAAHEFDSSAFECVPASPDLKWLRT